MQKDYVSRKQVKKKPPEPEKRSLPWFRIVITLGLVVGFAYFLWSIKGKAPEKPPQEIPMIELKPADPLPIMPDEEWEFIKTLPEYTVEVDLTEQAESDKRYLMQCGSFRNRSQAEEMKANIAFIGLMSQIRASEGKTGTWHRVILGPYTSKRKAETDRHAIKRVNINTCRIWGWDL